MRPIKPKIEKTNLHPRNLHRNGYDFGELIKTLPQLANCLVSVSGRAPSLDFGDPLAVKLLNKALLSHHYGIENWDIPDGFLCPPIPGRVDYLHYIADLLAEENNGIVPKGPSITGLDIGTGANCIYPLLGNAVYGWNFVAADIDPDAISNCVAILEQNPVFTDSISLQLQGTPRHIFKDIVLPEDRFAFTMCNPPFHASAEDAQKASVRKTTNLKTSPILNFGGQNAELWCEGGEIGFITRMIFESAKYPMQCLWFTTLVSKNSNLNQIQKILSKVNVAATRVVEMSQGQKTSRLVAWTFLSPLQRKNWEI